MLALGGSDIEAVPVPLSEPLCGAMLPPPVSNTKAVWLRFPAAAWSLTDQVPAFQVWLSGVSVVLKFMVVCPEAEKAATSVSNDNSSSLFTLSSRLVITQRNNALNRRHHTSDNHPIGGRNDTRCGASHLHDGHKDLKHCMPELTHFTPSFLMQQLVSRWLLPV
jgi:hypothetical protein